MDSRAVTRWVHLSPPKARLVIDLIRGKSVSQAIEILDNTPRRASDIIKQTLESAVANAMHREDGGHAKAEDLFIKTAFVDVGPSLKRFLTRAMGRATRIRKRLAHITIIVGEMEESKRSRSRKSARAGSPGASAPSAPSAGKAAKSAAKSESKAASRATSKNKSMAKPATKSVMKPKTHSRKKSG